MRKRDQAEAARLDAALSSFATSVRALPGIATASRRQSLIEQLVESVRRVNFVSVVARRNISPLRGDPESDLFDPIRAALLCKESDFEEACWLVFLSVHFGKNRGTGWTLVRQVYGRGNNDDYWSWSSVSSNPKIFRRWLAAHQNTLSGNFGNHRKYQSIDADKPAGTGAAVDSYVLWVSNFGSHRELFDAASAATNGDERSAFDWLYQSLDAVQSFGRMAKFDYLTMLAKIGLTSIEAGSTYMVGATGPYVGGNLLFANRADARIPRRDLDELFIQLADHLKVGMQVIEDAICNWQKSPEKFVGFRG